MRLFGLNITRAKATTAVVPSLPSSASGGWLSQIFEPFAGAWQRNLYGVDEDRDLLAFSAVYACVSLISSDISKLPLKLMFWEAEEEIWEEEDDPLIPFLSVLRKPNSWQTRIQFYDKWVVDLLLNGNAYVLKQRDQRGVVRSLYNLNPRLVVPLVAPDGSIFYQIRRDPLSGVRGDDGVTLPDSEIIHDRLICPWHPLVGVSAIYACAMSASQGRRIQRNSAKFFENLSRPSGMLTAPGHIPDDTAQRLKREWESNFQAGNIGRLAVLGDSLKYEALTMSAEDSQLIEQLRWTVEDVARCFKVPLHMLSIAGSNPSYNNIGALNQAYYSQTLQKYIESIELLIDEGLGLSRAGYGCEFDIGTLTRMDPAARADWAAKGIGAGYLTPNEARRVEGLSPVAGGDTPYMQQQNYSLAALAARDATNPLVVSAEEPEEPEEPEEDTPEDEAEDLAEGETEDDDSEEETGSSEAETEAAALAAMIIRGVLEDVDSEIAVA